MYSPKAVLSTLSAAILGFLVLGLVSTSAHAATTTADFNVSATVQATCSVSAGPLSFGNYSSTAVLDATSTITAKCTNTTDYTVSLNAGTATGATVTTRQMTGPSSLSYGLFRDSSHSSNWGDTTGSWATGTGNGGDQTLTIYGEIPAGQYATPGSYSDTIRVTVSY